jgi:glutamate-1-semialdehyde 2,1-aminomutase
LIFDEVITGFRVAPGGVQDRYGIVPDLTSLAKILAGGLPGGALAGRADVLDAIDFRPGKPKMRHPGTYNGNPLSAAAGIAALTHIATGEPCAAANETGRVLRNELNAMFTRNGWPWIAYIDFSMFRLIPNYHGPRPEPATAADDGMIPYDGDLNKLDGVPANPKLRHQFRMAMLLHGVDMPGLAGWIGAMHGPQEIAKTVSAVEQSVQELMAEGLVTS